GQPLAIAAREPAGQDVLAADQVGQLEHPLDAYPPLPAGDAVDGGVERDVLDRGQVVVEGEALGHVADGRLDPRGLGPEVEAEDPAATLGRLEDAAEHPEGGGLA